MPQGRAVQAQRRGGYRCEEIAAAFAVKPRTVEKHIATAMQSLIELGPEAASWSATRAEWSAELHLANRWV